MNYLKIYCALIRKAQNREVPNTYIEKHHIFPVSIFGKNNKIVRLTAREHYIAHALLEKAFIKRYGIHHIKTKKMTYAFWCMNVQKTKNEYLNSHFYEHSKVRYVNMLKGKILTDKHKNKVLEELKTRKWWNNGINHKHCAEKPGKEWVLGRLNINTGRIISEETKLKISEKNKGRRQTKEHKNKVSKELKTRRWWNNGEKNKHCPNCPGDEWVLGRLITKNKN